MDHLARSQNGKVLGASSASQSIGLFVGARRVVRLATTLALVGLALVSAARVARATPQTFVAGSLVIPMDTDTAGNHATYNQDLGMWKAYGLLHKLLRNGVPVYWAIKPDKAFNDIDFSVASVKDKRTNTALGAWNYRGGPFVIGSDDAAVALSIITAWWAANGNRPNVHEALVSFTADIDIILRSPPRIATEETNSAIAISYFTAAGIPDINGNPWSSSSPSVLDETEIANGAMFQAQVCLQRLFDTFVSAHNGGYAYSLTDPTNLGTRAYSQLDTFVHQGGGWSAMCHSILSNENNINDLTRNGSAAVKALFKTTLPGGEPGGFLTTNGFSTISNKAGTWTVNPAQADLPTAQAVATTVAQSLPGGSVQNWPSTGFPGAPTYWSETERIASFVSGEATYDQIVGGTYHNGTGTGKVTFLGGHSWATTVPYSSNFEAPYLRMFYNSLFFNGTAVAKLDLSYSPTTFPQNSTQPLFIGVTNTGASNAVNVNSVSITLEAGFTYLATTAGPAPDSVVGQTLTWNNLGTIASGATAVTVSVQVGAAISATVGDKKFGTLEGRYGDIFGEGFTINECRTIQVSPAPAPSVSKTLTSASPAFPGGDVTWTLAYQNLGTQTLLNAVVQDTLPPGFTFSSAIPTASLVIPGSPTIVRWSLGSLAAGASGTITVNMLAGPVTAGVGDPPQQTFTNNVTLTGNDAANNSYSASASADVVVEKPPLSLGKSVDKATVTSLPATLTYTLDPVYPGTVPLLGLMVTDVIPGADPDVPSVSPYATLVPGVGSPNAGGYCNGDPSVACSGLTAYEVDWDIGSTTPGVPGVGAQAGTAFCPTTVTLTGTTNSVDTYLSRNQPNNNFGTATTFLANANKNNIDSSKTKYPLLRFDLSSIPAGAVIQSAKLSVTVTTNRSNQIEQIRVMNTAWTEGGATWNDSDGAGPGDWAGGTFGAADYKTTVEATISPTTKGTKTAFVTTAVDGWVNGSVPNNGFVLLSTGTNTGDAVYSSSEAGSGKPTLTVTYLVETAAPLPPSCAGGADITLYSVADNFLNSANTTQNNGTATTMDMRPSERYPLVQFDLSSIPPGATLSKADFQLYVTANDTVQTDDVHAMLTPWDETTSTWATRNGTTPWSSSGGTFGTSDYAATILGSFKPTPQNAYQPATPVDVMSVAQGWVDGSVQNRGLVLVSSTVTTNTAKFGTRENAGRQPKLVVNWTLAPSAVQTTTTIAASPLLITNSGVVTVILTTTTTGAINNVTPPTDLIIGVDGGITAAKASGPTGAAPVDLPAGGSASWTYTYNVTIDPNATPGELFFSGKPAPALSFQNAVSNSVIVTPSLTFTIQVGGPPPDQIVNVGTITGSGTTETSPPATTNYGPPVLTISKTNSPASITPVNPGDPIEYSLTVQNTGPTAATNVLIEDNIPANTTYVSCTSACTTTGGPVTKVSWTIASVAPGAVQTVAFTVTGNSAVPIGSTTLTNTATVRSTEVSTPQSSNSVTNTLEVLPTVAKFADVDSVTAGGNITFSIVVNNPGNSFVGDVRDVLPANTTFFSCTGCTSSGPPAAVNWNGITLNTGDNTFIFTVTVSPSAEGGDLILNTATVDPTTPDLPAISSNQVSVPVGPDLQIAKSHNPAGTVSIGDAITYTLLVANESPVPANGTIVSDVVPANTTYVAGSCSGGASCSQSGGTVTWNVGIMGPGASTTLSFQVTVVPPTPGTDLIDNVAQVDCDEQLVPRDSNHVENQIGAVPTSSATSTPTATPTATQPTATSTPTPTRTTVARGTPTPCDLAPTLRKVHAGTLRAGANVTYTITWSNPCREDLRDVVITDTLPAGLSLISATSDAATVFVDGNSVTFRMALLPMGPGHTGTILAHIEGDVPANTVLLNVATITDSRNHTNSAIDRLRVHGGGSAIGMLSCAIRAQIHARPGTYISYTVRYKNGSASNEVVLSLPPSDVDILSFYPPPTTQSENTIIWQGVPKTAGMVKARTQVRWSAGSGTTLPSNAVVTDAFGNSAVCEHTSVVLTTERIGVAVKTQSKARPGTVLTYVVRYNHVGGGNEMKLAIPPGMSVLESIPAVTVASDNVLTYQNLPEPAGTVKVRAAVATDAVEGALLKASVTLTDENADVVTSQCRTEVSVFSTGSEIDSGSSTLSLTGQHIVRPGSYATYTVRYGNPGTAESVSLTLPSGVTLNVAQPAPSASNGNVLTWQGLASSGSFKVNVQVAATATGTLTAFATIDGAGGRIGQAMQEMVVSSSTSDSGGTPGTATITLTAPRRVSHGLTADLFIDYRNLVGSGKLTLTLPAELSPVLTVPAASTGAGNQVTWSTLKGPTGSAKVRVLVAANAPAGSVLTISAVLTDERATPITTTTDTNVR